MILWLILFGQASRFHSYFLNGSWPFPWVSIDAACPHKWIHPLDWISVDDYFAWSQFPPKTKTSKLISKCPSSAVKCWNQFIFSPFVPIVQDKKIKKHQAGPKSMRFSYLSFACGFVLPQGRGRSDVSCPCREKALATHVTTPWLKADVYSDMCDIVYGCIWYIWYIYILYINHLWL